MGIKCHTDMACRYFWQNFRFWDTEIMCAAGFERLVVRPFKGSLLCSLPQFSGEHAERQLWGTYRPGLYLGRLPLRNFLLSVFVILAFMKCSSFAVSFATTEPRAEPKIICHGMQQSDVHRVWVCTRGILCAGLRMRHPQSLVAGMMWFDPDRPDVSSNIRHLALERDGVAHLK